MFEGKIIRIDASKDPIPKLKIETDISNHTGSLIIILGYSTKVFFADAQIANETTLKSSKIDDRGKDRLSNEILISPFIFGAIEKSRCNSDVQIRIVTDVEYIIPPHDNIPKIERIIIDDNLSQTQWIDFIANMGYNRYKIFEMPFPDMPQFPEFEDIMKTLESAQTLFYEGKNEEVVNKCRTVLERFRTILNDEKMKTKIDNKIDERCIGEEGRDPKSKRIHEIFTKVYNFHNVGPHYPYFVAREDAELSLVMCMSLLRYYYVQLDKLTSGD
ncbi:MAG: hypothetical protein JXA38_01625 [Methanosarcinaceae archaeon]|nr:hypothetical protein [Methanosarcinaceae archaeon]